jgi:hypothetical protein
MKKSLFTAFAVGLGLTASLFAQVPSYVPTNGLVGWWPFNGNANDESGNGNNGTVNGATLTTDRFGNANKAYSFDGVDDFIVGDCSLFPSNERTISFWFNSEFILGKSNFIGYGGGNCGSSFNLYANFQACGVQGLNSFGYSSHCCQNNFNQSYQQSILSNWNCLILTSNNDSTSLYLNGNLIFSDQITINNTDNLNKNFVFGGLVNINGIGFYPETLYNGIVDDFGIWNRVLSECEIQDLYNSQFNSVAGTIAVSPNSASLGDNVTLSTASNSTNLQWQTNGVNLGWQNVPSNSTYSGGTTTTLTVNNVQLANHNQPFRVIASNGNCTDTSNIATIQIADTCFTNVTVYDTLLTTVTDTLIINTTLSLPAPNNENTILIYPNPASDHITIDNGNFAAMAGYSIKIENNVGQQVFQSAINQAQFYVDLSTWTGNGLYFVHLIDPQNNTVTVRKIVLQ